MNIGSTSLVVCRPRSKRVGRAVGFTLIELLIVIAIITLLIGLLIPALASTMGAARSFKCQMGMRSVAFDFDVFADDQLHGSRGNDDTELLHGRFQLETFQNAQYGINEFWAYGSQRLVSMPDAQGRDPMRCPAVRGVLVLRKFVPCSDGGVTPWPNVSYGFNVRLHLSDKLAAQGQSSYIMLTSGILLGGPGAPPSAIPLSWDVDGFTAMTMGNSPVYSGPTLDSKLLFKDGRYWFPALRHNSALNLSFIDGHVDSSRNPLQKPNVAWGYDPTP